MGLFCIIGDDKACGAPALPGIGFVSYFLVVGVGGLGSFRAFGLWLGRGYGDWVRFAQFGWRGGWQDADVVNWVRFAFLGSWPCGIGFVFHNRGDGEAGRMAGVRGLGSFCIFWMLAFGSWQLALWNWVRFP